MIVLFVLAIFALMIVIDVIWIHPKETQSEKVKQEVFYTPEVGYTMCDGGEKIEEKKDEKKS